MCSSPPGWERRICDPLSGRKELARLPLPQAARPSSPISCLCIHVYVFRPEGLLTLSAPAVRGCEERSNTMNRICLLCLALVAVWAAPVLADDFMPPTYRGAPLSYLAEWEFASQGVPTAGIAPDYESWVDDDDPTTFLYDKFATHIDVDGDGWQYDPADGDGGLVNPNRDGSIGCNVINWVDQMPIKELRIQITYIGLAPSITGVTGYVYYGSSIFPDQEAYPGDFVCHGDCGEGRLFEDWIILPNPDWEQIEIFVPQGTILDQIYIDSVSPEPATMALMGIGTVALLRRRK